MAKGKFFLVPLFTLFFFTFVTGSVWITQVQAIVTCYQSCTSGNPNNGEIHFPGVSYDSLTGWRTYSTIAQQFQTTTNRTVNTIKLYNLSITGSPGDAILGIWRTSGPYSPYYAHMPLSVPAEGMATVNTAGPSNEWVSFRLDKPVNLTAGTVYAVTLRVDYPASPPAPPTPPPNYWSIQRGFTNPYTSGRIVYFTNSGWATMSDDQSDLFFEVCYDTDAHQDNITTGTGSGTADFYSDAGTIETVDPLAAGDLPIEAQNTLPPVNFPHGFFDITITDLQDGATVNLTITLPSNVPAGWVWWYYVDREGWNSIPIGSDDGDNVITITKTDGAAGDTDNAINGIIVDPGGVAQAWQEQGGAIPTLNQWGGIILSMLLIGSAALAMKRKKQPRKLKNT
ncbi:MAG: hypothetical protein HF978_05820 [Desulfobacteraceae bacterium]|nr:hypothetical protein [Desulfobacteraceae bacterium]MBC2755051.1 hypothetical protein [Desulfobacteraceae bacterium]